ncbi:MAG: proton-conducting transporter membrane subunit [Candidatus Competibacterales bacterium]
MLFAAIAAGLWPLNSLYSIGYMRGNDEKHQTRFYVCFAIAIASALGVAFAGNLLTLFICYEALTLSTYPLVTHKGNADAVRAGRIYLGLLLTTSIGLLLPAIVWTYFVAGTVDFRPGGILAGNLDTGTAGILLALFLFGIGKAALMPFHRWLPSAMVAPTPVSALLHAVAVVKAGVFTVLKVVVYIFGVDYLHGSDGSFWLTVVAAFTLLTASIIAITKDNLKARLAYSTVSQLAYVVLGAALATATGVLGGAFQIAMHAMGKITLFFCAGAIYTAAHKTEISQMDGLGRTMPLTYIAFFLGALSIIGLPPFGGAWSKWYLMLGAADAEQTFAIVVLMMSSLLSLGYLIPIVARGFFLAPPGGFKGIAEAPWFCLVPLMITATGCIILFFAANNLYQLLEPIIQTSIDENLSHGN